MKYKRIVTITAFMLLFATGVWAGVTVNIIKKVNGEAAEGTTSPGTVNHDIIEGICTLTVTPASGLYVTSDFMTVSSTVTGEMAQARRMAPNLDISHIDVTPTDPDANPSQVTSYMFNIPADGCEIEVIVDFQSRKSLTEAMISLSPTSFTFNGGVQTPTVTVQDGETSLTKDKDYTIRYKKEKNGEWTVTDNPTDIGTYCVIVTAISSYTGEISSEPFTITPVDLQSLGVTISDINARDYNGTAYKPEVTVTVGEGQNAVGLVKDVDYTPHYADSVNAGSAKLTIEGIGNYSGAVEQAYTINPVTLTATPKDLTINAGEEPVFEFQYDGFVNNETKAVLTTEPTGSYGNADITKPGKYQTTANGGVAQNYVFEYETGWLTVNRLLDVNFSDGREWATYCATEDLATPDGLQAYQVTTVEETTVTTAEVAYIPKNTAVLLRQTTSGASLSAVLYDGATSSFPDNLLQGTTVPKDVKDIDGTVYVIYNNEFVKSTKGTIPALRGYLVLNGNATARALSIVIGDVSGITSIYHAQDAMHNEVYNLNGQRVSKAQKGLYIVNGKKVFVK